jgi:hypothetical protein
MAESGTYVKFTSAGAELFAQVPEGRPAAYVYFFFKAGIVITIIGTSA